jgi:hypothetical protein
VCNEYVLINTRLFYAIYSILNNSDVYAVIFLEKLQSSLYTLELAILFALLFSTFIINNAHTYANLRSPKALILNYEINAMNCPVTIPDLSIHIFRTTFAL